MPSSATTMAEPLDTRSVLIVDDDAVMCDYVRVCLESELPDVVVTVYDAGEQGRPGSDFDWGAHDLVLLDYNLGNGENGLEWLETFGKANGFPPTILITAESSPGLVGKAIHNGAVGHINKTHLDPGKLCKAVRDALDGAGAGTGSGTTADSSLFGGQVTGKGAAQAASYKFIRVIGKGAMSRVYLAERIGDRITVVLKVLSRDVARDPENVQRFAREGEMLARVHSPYVVKIYDHGMTNSYGYIAMEFFGRGDLAQRMAQGVTPEDAVLYLQNIACGLDAIHREGIIHRDLKPGNIMFRGDDSMALVDFGLSKRRGVDMSLTQTGVILGTPYCMSPEQTKGDEVDHRTDLYAAGVMFFEMLTGKRPYTAPNLPALLLAIQTKPVPRLPAELQTYQPIVDRLLAKSADYRFQTASELIAALQELPAAA